MPKKQTTRLAARTPEKPVSQAEAVTPTPTSPGESAPITVLAKPEVRKIQGLLKSKTSDGVTLGLSLLESLGATAADYEAVFSETVIKSVLNGWMAESWGTVAKALVPHGAVSEVFQRLAEERYLKRPGKTGKLRDFGGLLHARVPLARPAFLSAWGDARKSQKPFIDLVDMPAGSFTMGSPEDEADRLFHENQVQVRITKPFRMGRTVITQGQWRAVMGTEPWRYAGLDKNVCGDDFPAVHVSWDDAVLFCETLTGLERETGRLTASQSYRLPTEAEWEYACRAGATTAYSFGDDPEQLAEYGWFGENSGGKLHPVAQKKPNPWGLFDMHGNVFEWCADWYNATLAGGDDPVGPAAGSCRVYRGGSWYDVASCCRSAYRYNYAPWYRYVYGAFRVVVLC